MSVSRTNSGARGAISKRDRRVTRSRPLRVLIIINGALEHRPFYGRVGAELIARGHDVQFLLDSHYTDFLYPEVELDASRTHYFSDYFQRHYGRTELPSELAGSNAWTMAFPDIDRLMFTRFGPGAGDGHHYESMLANLGHFLVELFDRYRFDAVVYENVSNAIAYFSYEVAKKRGAKYLGFVPSRLPGRTDVVDYKYARDSALKEVFEQLRDGRIRAAPEVEAWVTSYLEQFDEKVPDYMGKHHPFEMGMLRRYARASSWRRFTRSVAYRFSRSNDLKFSQLADPLFVFPEQVMKEGLKHARRFVAQHRFYDHAPNLDGKYFVYALQFHPESATSVDGAAFNDEWSNVVGIARNLPFGMRLYVKDHKHAAGREPLAFYERVARIPNVTLVHPDVPTKALIRNAQAVVVLTTTMGYEALVLGKPVFVLGHPFYEFAPGCVRVPSFDEAHDLFARYAEFVPPREAVRALIAAYYMTSVPGSLDILTQYDDLDVVRWIADTIQSRLGPQVETAC